MKPLKLIVKGREEEREGEARHYFRVTVALPSPWGHCVPLGALLYVYLHVFVNSLAILYIAPVMGPPVEGGGKLKRVGVCLGKEVV